MFNKEIETSSSQNAETVIGPSIKVKGDFHGEGDIIIEGNVEGEISTKKYISVGPNAKIIANISANSAKIAGTVKGGLIVSSYLEILKTAVIKGDLSAKEISIEKGAVIDGKVTMTNKETISKENK